MKFIDLAPTIKQDRARGPITGLDGESYALTWLDEHPDQTPGGTILASTVESETKDMPKRYVEGYMDALDGAKITVIVDNSKPTNEEELRSLLEAWTDEYDGGTETLTEYLDRIGVKAPGGE